MKFLYTKLSATILLLAYSSNAALIRYQYDSLGHSITPGTPNHGDRNNPGQSNNDISGPSIPIHGNEGSEEGNNSKDINGGNNSDNKNGEDNGEGSNPKGANGESEVDEGDNNNNNSGDNEDDHDTSNGGGNPSEKKKGNKPGENNGKHNDPSDSLIKINAQGLQLLNNVNALTGISNGQLKQGTHDQKDANNPDGLDNHDGGSHDSDNHDSDNSNSSDNKKNADHIGGSLINAGLSGMRILNNVNVADHLTNGHTNQVVR